MTFMKAIAREEGFGIPGARATRNNNPGNLNFAAWQESLGAVLETTVNGEKARFAHFPTAEAGWDAMRKLLTFHGYVGLTVSDALNRWAPPIENQTNSYIAGVCEMTGMTPDTVLTSENIG